MESDFTSYPSIPSKVMIVFKLNIRDYSYVIKVSLVDFVPLNKNQFTYGLRMTDAK